MGEGVKELNEYDDVGSDVEVGVEEKRKATRKFQLNLKSMKTCLFKGRE